MCTLNHFSNNNKHAGLQLQLPPIMSKSPHTLCYSRKTCAAELSTRLREILINQLEFTDVKLEQMEH